VCNQVLGPRPTPPGVRRRASVGNERPLSAPSKARGTRGHSASPPGHAVSGSRPHNVRLLRVAAQVRLCGEKSRCYQHKPLEHTGRDRQQTARTSPSRQRHTRTPTSARRGAPQHRNHRAHSDLVARGAAAAAAPGKCTSRRARRARPRRARAQTPSGTAAPQRPCPACLGGQTCVACTMGERWHKKTQRQGGRPGAAPALVHPSGHDSDAETTAAARHTGLSLHSLRPPLPHKAHALKSGRTSAGHGGRAYRSRSPLPSRAYSSTAVGLAAPGSAAVAGRVAASEKTHRSVSCSMASDRVGGAAPVAEEAIARARGDAPGRGGGGNGTEETAGPTLQ